MAGIFIPRVRSVSTLPAGDDNFAECSNCWLPFEFPKLESSIECCTSIVVGIHRVVRYTSDTPELMQYHDGEWSPFIREVFSFCPLCSPSMVERFFLIVAECTGLTYDFLLTKPDMSELNPGLGHFITLREFVPGRLGRYFNIQMDKATYRKLVTEYIPRNVVYFHEAGGRFWRTW